METRRSTLRRWRGKTVMKAINLATADRPLSESEAGGTRSSGV